MSARQLNRRLNSEDAAFLLMDTDESPQNIGSIAIFEGDIDFRRFVANIEAKLHLIPRYTQKITEVPFNLARPTWESDSAFDIRNHVFEMTLEGPGSDDQLVRLASKVAEGRLNRDKPLWEINLVHGLSGGRSALLSKVHHCLVDGVGGVEMLMIVLDVSPESGPPPVAPASKPEAPPTRASLLIDALFDNAEESIERWAEWHKGVLDFVEGDLASVNAIRNGLRRALPYFMNEMTPACFNGKFSGRRQIAVTSYPFEQVRGVRKAICGTVNDVVLAVVTLAMREYLRQHGETVEGREFRVLTPVNLRREDETGMMGNRISMLLVELPLYLSDPEEVLRVIAARTEKLKEEHAADGIEMIGRALMSLPPAATSVLSMLPAPKNTVANMVCTNVPGPMIPLYTVGHKLLEHYALAPLGWEMGAGVALTSYNQRLYITLQSDAALTDDMEKLRELFDIAYREVCHAAGVDMEAAPPMAVLDRTAAA